jgi:hypothetical protein
MNIFTVAVKEQRQVYIPSSVSDRGCIKLDAKPEYCHTVKHSDKLLQKAKSATYTA